MTVQSFRIPKKQIWRMSGKTDRSINAPRENSSFAFRDKKPKLFTKIISFGYNFWNYIYLASYPPKNNRIALIRSAQSKISQSICQRCYVTLTTWLHVQKLKIYKHQLYWPILGSKGFSLVIQKLSVSINTERLMIDFCQFVIWKPT